MAWPILLAVYNAAQATAQQGPDEVPQPTATIGEITMQNKKRACWRQIQRKLKQEYDAALPETPEAQRREMQGETVEGLQNQNADLGQLRCIPGLNFYSTRTSMRQRLELGIMGRVFESILDFGI